MDYTFIYNTLLGFLIALIWDILNRSKESENTPKKFDIVFFWNDNKVRLILTFCLSLFVMLAVFFNVKDAAYLFGKEWTELNNLIYIIIGAAPDLIISFAKRKVGFLQPQEVNGYVRAQNKSNIEKEDEDGGGAVTPKKGF